ncbi:MAG: excinuclease ABC subunit UvrC [Bacilli bacterium]
MNEIIKQKLANLPKKPGSYQYYNAQGVIIYVGKAKNLYNRVHSYFVGTHDAKTMGLVREINDLEYIITSTETEALILEMNLVKQHHPKFNISLMDDKKYPYIVLTDEEYPRLLYTRDLRKHTGKVYGPYPNAYSAKMVCEELNRIYPVRKCNVLQKKECLYYHLNQCLAPCIKTVPSNSYVVIKKKINNILKGNVDTEIKLLKSSMEDAANKLNYEKAKEYRDFIDHLKIISEKQKMEGYMKDSDIFAYFSNDKYMSIQVFHLRDGKMIKRDGYLQAKESDAENQLTEFIYKFYLVELNPVPYQIIMPFKGIDKNIIKTHIIVPLRGQKKHLLDLVQNNAKEKADILILNKQANFDKTIGATKELGSLLGITLHSIEAFDNSNIMGASPVSAMVKFVDGMPDRKSYRKYKIKTVVGANEAATMKEVITRRYKNLTSLPDLIIMDGGAIQVNSAISALSLIGVNIPVLGLVKDENHKTNQLYFQGKIIKLEKKKYLFKMLEFIQEEVHRFAITFFRKVHQTSALESEIDKIPGIGPKKKKAILMALGKDNFLANLQALKLSANQIDLVKKIYK